MRGARGPILLAAALLFSTAPASGQVPFAEEPRALVFVVDGLSYEDALDDPVVGAVALSGGIGLMTPTVAPDELRENLRQFADGRRTLLFPTSPAGLADAIGNALRENSEASRTLVLIVVPEPSAEMRARTGGITPVVMATGTPDLVASPDLDGLTSDTTRREGIVSNVDVAATIAGFHRLLVSEGLGAPITATERTPTELLRRYEEYREIVTPVGLAVLALALAALVASLLVLLGPWSAPGAARTAATVGLAAIALQVALLPASWLPSYEPGVVWPVLALVGAAVTLAAWVAGRRSPYLAVAVVAGAGLGLVVVDAALGWPSLLTPLLGGSALEGTRFYGLGNPYAGMVLAGSVFIAAMLRPWAGVGVLLAAALFAGLPWLGADLGGGITLFAVAGAWIALRIRGGPGILGVALATGIAAVIGAALLILAHGVIDFPTHVTRAVDQADGLPGILSAFWERLALNLETTVRTPAVWPALVGVPVWLVVAWTRAGPFRPTLEAAPAWRDALVALAVGGILGYVLNDTYGTAGVAFIYLSLGAVYPAVVLGPWRRSSSSPSP